MRFIDSLGFASSKRVHALALLSVVGLLSGCPKKEPEATPEPAAATPPPSDKAGADAPAAAAPAAGDPAAAPTAGEPAATAHEHEHTGKHKKKDDGGW